MFYLWFAFHIIYFKVLGSNYNQVPTINFLLWRSLWLLELLHELPEMVHWNNGT